ncbi:lysM domain receptor-like kinase 4 [Stylosanthes scabra]|uniref:LysM domain receptor-like kinase 4 n=1 Tax=Stylosanthes scabra TaxID=79078 RepID=A0ABU6WDG4_9FABA|nr:lysM domain receptor-like kinase 4 [Stylosanthes scabra]
MRLFFLFIIIITNSSLIKGQQPYIGLGTVACPRRGNTKSIRGYTCNGFNHTCQAYLTFRSQPLYSSVSTISTLLNSDPSQLALINSVSLNETFEPNTLVIVPVNCSCASEYYQSNTTYVAHNAETNFLIANNTFQGLSTCQALEHQNANPSNIYPGRQLLVPLRCACPTRNQTLKGVRYLLSYLVDWGDSISAISQMFNVTTQITLEANSLTMMSSLIYPFTTILVPLHDKPFNLRTSSPPSQPPSSSSSSSGSADKSSKKTWVYVIVGVVGGFALIFVTCAVIFFTCTRKTKRKQEAVTVSKSFEATEKPQGKIMEQESGKLSEIIASIAQSFKVYDFEELQRATDNFSTSCWMKGSVYRGVINGDFAAIKKVEGDISKEIQVLNKVNHSNVIRLSGVSFYHGQWYLVYEYAANGALSDWIYLDNIDGKFLSWRQRIQIALDVATGLDYLHSFTSPPYIHKDLNCSNILLDSDLRAKVANFSLARSVEGGKGQFPMTRHIVGTRGYMAPEYLENGVVSTKLDVYAFGVLVLEILTGKEVAEILNEDDNNNKGLSNALSVILGEESGKERVKEFMCASLQGNYPSELAMVVIRMIHSCIKKEPENRPQMQEIVASLSRILNSSLNWETSVSLSASKSF